MAPYPIFLSALKTVIMPIFVLLTESEQFKHISALLFVLVALQKSVTCFCCAPSPPYLETTRPWGRGCGMVRRLAVCGGKFWPPYLNSVLSRQGS